MKLTYVLLLAIALAINVNAQGEEQAVPLTTAEEAASKSDEQKGADAAAAAEGKTAEGLQPVGQAKPPFSFCGVNNDQEGQGNLTWNPDKFQEAGPLVKQPNSPPGALGLDLIKEGKWKGHVGKRA